MEIKVDVVLSFPRDRVYAAYRDRLAELTEYLPNIRSIKVLKREERPGEVHLVNEWDGGGEIPSAARAFLNESMLKWTDYATWKDASFTVEWRSEAHSLPDAVLTSGTSRFFETPNGARFEVRGDLTWDASRVPGVPRLMARALNSAMEKVLVGRISENLVEVAKGVEKLLTDERR
jgi:uncharacterized membrane protein